MHFCIETSDFKPIIWSSVHSQQTEKQFIKLILFSNKREENKRKELHSHSL